MLDRKSWNTCIKKSWNLLSFLNFCKGEEWGKKSWNQENTGKSQPCTHQNNKLHTVFWGFCCCLFVFWKDPYGKGFYKNGHVIILESFFFLLLLLLSVNQKSWEPFFFSHLSCVNIFTMKNINAYDMTLQKVSHKSAILIWRYISQKKYRNSCCILLFNISSQNQANNLNSEIHTQVSWIVTEMWVWVLHY